jgi:hypothetical protein
MIRVGGPALILERLFLPRSLACPDVDSGGFWTPAGVSDAWWQSPPHYDTLYADTRPHGLACGAAEPIENALAYQTVACLTLMDDQ